MAWHWHHKITIVFVAFCVLVTGGYLLFLRQAPTSVTLEPMNPNSTMKLTSPLFADGQGIPQAQGYRFGNKSPSLAIDGVPEQAKSLVIIMHDPDSPSGDWLHWSIWNIPPLTKEIAESTVPAGALQGTNDFGEASYGGPAPHDGTHHYVFDIYALDNVLDLPLGASRQQLEQAMSGHVMEKTQLTGLFSA